MNVLCLVLIFSPRINFKHYLIDILICLILNFGIIWYNEINEQQLKIKECFVLQ